MAFGNAVREEILAHHETGRVTYGNVNGVMGALYPGGSFEADTEAAHATIIARDRRSIVIPLISRFRLGQLMFFTI